MRLSVNPYGIKVSLMFLQFSKLLYFLFLVPIYTWMLVAPEHLWTKYCPSISFGCAISPYGIPWYIFYFTITRWGYLWMGIILWIVDSIVTYQTYQIYSYRHTMLFTLSSFLFFILNPIDLLALWFAVRQNWKYSILAIVTKLPIGSEILLGNLSIYQYIFTVSFNSGGLLGYPLLSLWRYILLGLWIISPTFKYINNRLEWIWYNMKQDWNNT